MSNTTTREGVCAKCSQHRPLFKIAFDPSPRNEEGAALVCARCYSEGEQLKETVPQEMCFWLPPRPHGWSPWIPKQLDHHRERPTVEEGAR
jgi:hypothetical protein